jgi:hypothetical protein
VLHDLIRAHSTAALDSDGERLLLRTDVTGVDQLAEWHAAVHRSLTAVGEG